MSQEHQPKRDSQISESIGRGLPLFRPKEQFNLGTVTEKRGVSPLIRQISPYEKAHTIGNYSYIVWTEGPKTGIIYRVVTAPTPEQATNLKTVGTIQEETLQKLEDIERIEHDAHRSGRGLSYSMTDEGTDALANIAVDLHKLYYGDATTVGAEKAQLFDLDGEGEKYFDWVNATNPPTGRNGYRGYLHSLAETHNLNYAKEHLLSGIYTDHSALYRYFFADSALVNNTDLSPRFPVQLTHATHGNVLTNLVQVGVLAAPNYFGEHGIKKQFGGEGRGDYSYTPNDVSFWHSHSGYSGLSHGFVGKEGFEYPMIVGVDQEHTSQLDLFEDTIRGAKRVSNFAPFTHLFVPYFKVPEVRRIMASHDMEDIKVLSLAGKT